MTTTDIITDIKYFDEGSITSTMPPVQRGQFDQKNGARPIQYNQILMRYKHPTEHGVHTANMLIQGPQLVIKNGIQRPSETIANEDGRRPPCSIYTELTGPAGEQLIRMFTGAWEFAARTICAHVQFAGADSLGSVGKKINTSDKDKGLASIKMLLSPPYRTRSDAPPDRYTPLIEYDNVIKTTFERYSLALDRMVPVNPLSLFDCQLEIIPVFFCKRTFIGNNSSVQWYFKSVTVVSRSDKAAPAVRTNAAREAALANRAAAEAMDRNEEMLVSGPVKVSSVTASHTSPKPPQGALEHSDNHVVDHTVPEWAREPPTASATAPTPAANAPSNSATSFEDDDDDVSTAAVSRGGTGHNFVEDKLPSPTLPTSASSAATTNVASASDNIPSDTTASSDTTNTPSVPVVRRVLRRN